MSGPHQSAARFSLGIVTQPFARLIPQLGIFVLCPNALCVQKERFPDLAAEKAAWEKEQAGKAKAAAAVSVIVLKAAC